MPHFYFDVHNGDGATSDDIGQELAVASQVKRMAARILTDIARDELPVDEKGQVTVSVRDGGGREIYRASLSFISEDFRTP